MRPIRAAFLLAVTGCAAAPASTRLAPSTLGGIARGIEAFLSEMAR